MAAKKKKVGAKKKAVRKTKAARQKKAVKANASRGVAKRPPADTTFEAPPRIARLDQAHRLPTRALVAFAARCARRVAPIYEIWGESALRTPLQNLLLVTEAYGRGKGPPPAKKAVSDLMEAGGRGETPHVAADAAKSALRAIAFAAALATDPADFRVLYIEDLTRECVNALSKYSTGGKRGIATEDLMRRDLTLVQHRARIDRWSDDTPVPVNFFGPIWPTGEPDGWPQEPATSDEREATAQSQDARPEEDAHLEMEPSVPSTEDAVEEVEHAASPPFDVETEIRSLFEDLKSLKDAVNASDDTTAAIRKELLAEMATFRDDAATIAENRKADVARIQEQAAEANKQLDERAKQLNHLRNALATTLVTGKSTEFWEEKAKRHRRGFRFWGTAVLVAGGVLMWALYRTWSNLFGTATENDFPSWQIGFALLSGTVSLLLLRILSRIAMSHLHLASDAQERRVMIQTYTALTHEGKLEEDQYSLILQAIFKPSSSGLIKEDVVPPSVLDLAARYSQGGGK